MLNCLPGAVAQSSGDRIYCKKIVRFILLGDKIILCKRREERR